ncbi:MAG: hypothetical protein ACREJC_22950 [Tepidisphaeraceae bacterium]
MPKVKTAISIESRLFRQVDRFAKRARVPRSQVFAEGARRLLRELSSKEITRRINAALAGDDQAEERAYARAASASMARIWEREGDRW